MNTLNKYNQILDTARDKIDQARIKAAEIKGQANAQWAEEDQMAIRAKQINTDLKIYTVTLKRDLVDLFQQINAIIES